GGRQGGGGRARTHRGAAGLRGAAPAAAERSERRSVCPLDRGSGWRLAHRRLPVTRMPSVRIEDLRACLAAAFGALGLDEGGADELAGLLIDSELRGHRDHGVAALGLLSRLYKEGVLNPRPEVRVVSETGGALLLDGDRGCGPGPPMR